MATLKLTRTVKAPVARVFRAWTDVSDLRKWLAPHPYEMREAEADPRPGGRYSITVVGPEGDEHRTWGEYVEFEQDRRLVQTWIYDGPYGKDDRSRLTVEFREVEAGVTEIVLQHTHVKEGEQEERARSGWNLCLDKLTALVETPGKE